MNGSSSGSFPSFVYALGFGLFSLLSFKAGSIGPAIVLAVFAVLSMIAQFLFSPNVSSSDTPETPEPSSVNPVQDSPDPSPMSSDPPADPTFNASSMLPVTIRGHSVAYRYDDVGIFVPKDSTFDAEGFEPGAVLTLFQDKTNENDPHAVGLRLRNRLVGYLYRGKLQDMANDWCIKGLPMRAVLTKCQREDRRAEVLLAFYDLSDFKKLCRRYPDAKEYRLTYNTSEEMQDNLLLCSKGEECEIWFDFEREKYRVDSGFEIGCLPASAEKLVDQYGDESCRVFIADKYTNDNGKTVVTVYIFPTE